eukprot:14503279-Alexandrium_andersonii.AAC.1
MPTPVTVTPSGCRRTRNCSRVRKATSPARHGADPPRQWWSSTTSPAAHAAASRARLARQSPSARCTVIATSST